MQRRVYLMFVLFLVLAAFYASVMRGNAPVIQSEQKAQTELFNQLDEQALSQAGRKDSASGN